MAERLDCDVAVVGGGIAGAACASAFARAGFEVRLLERGAPPAAFDPERVDPRVYAIAPSSAAFLDTLDIWESVATRRACAIEGMRVWKREPESALRFDPGSLAGPALGWIVEHGLLADAVWRSLPPSAVRAGASVAGAEFHDEGVRLRLDDGSTLTAHLAVGAEGAESPLRDAAGIDTAGWRYGAVAVVCHCETSLPHRGEALQRFLPEGPLALLPLPDGRRSLVWSVPGELSETLLAVDDAAFASRLEEAVQGVAGGIARPTRRIGFPLRLLHATRYVAAGFALVGDSAHVIHPLAGQGLNLGLADAEALVSVAAAARGEGRTWWALRELQRYERRRQAANLEMLALTDALHRGFASRVPGLPALLGRGLSLVDRIPPIKDGLARRAAR